MAPAAAACRLTAANAWSPVWVRGTTHRSTLHVWLGCGAWTAATGVYAGGAGATGGAGTVSRKISHTVVWLITFAHWCAWRMRLATVRGLAVG